MSCKPTYKGIRYNSLAELYKAVNQQQVDIDVDDNVYSSQGGWITDIKANIATLKPGDKLVVMITPNTDETKRHRETGEVYKRFMDILDTDGNNYGAVPYYGAQDKVIEALDKGKEVRLVVVNVKPEKFDFILEITDKPTTKTKEEITEALKPQENEEQPTNPVSSTKTLQEEQITAAEKANNWLKKSDEFARNFSGKLTDEMIINNLMFLLSGQGGTGKTYTTEVILEGKRVQIFAAPTHQARGVLQANIGEDDEAITVQSLLGMKPITSTDENGVRKLDFYALSEDEVKMARMISPKFMENFFHSNFIVIDEASQLSGQPLSAPKMEKIFNEKTGRYDNKMIYFGPPLGSYLLNMIKLKYEMTGILTKVYFMGDIGQTVPIGSNSFSISSLLEKIIKSGNTAMLEKPRRVKDDNIQKLNDRIREHFFDIYKRPLEQRGDVSDILLNILVNAPYNDNTLVQLKQESQVIDVFAKHYIDNMNNEEADPEYTAIINYNSVNHNWSKQRTKLVRQRIFGALQSNEINDGELIVANSVFTKKIDENTSYTIAKDTKIIFRNPEKKEIRIKIPTKNRDKFITITTTVAEAVINDPVKGLMKISVPIKDNDIKKAEKEYWTTRKQTGQPTGMFADLKPGELFTAMEKLLDYNYGYIVNNYKVQGSGIKFPIVHAVNIMGAPVDALHMTTFMYTATSRVKEKMYIFLPYEPDAPTVTPDSEKKKPTSYPKYGGFENLFPMILEDTINEFKEEANQINKICKG